MNNKKITNIILSFIIMFIMLALIGFSYAFFQSTVSGNEEASSVIFDSGILSLNYIDSEYIYGENILAPWTATKTFTIENTGTSIVEYNIMWETLTNTLVGKDALTYTITSTGVGAKTLPQTQIPNSGTDINILQSISISPGVIHTYIVTFNYALTSYDQTSDMEKLFNGKFKVVGSEGVFLFEYTGAPQQFTAPESGVYNIELWGSRGGANGGTTAGYGSYTSGDIYLQQGEKIFVYVGGYSNYVIGSCYATNPNNSFNGSIDGSCAGGGGATDVRLVSGNWSDALSLNSRIMVAGGGGGTFYPGKGGDAGGLMSYPGQGTGGGTYTVGAAVNQIGSSFGIAIKSTTVGGGGYYGGIGGYGGNASGGSSYISGHVGSVAIAQGSTSAQRAVKKTGCLTGSTDVECSIHYSNKMFTNTKMIDGAGYSWTHEIGDLELMPNFLGGFNESGVGNDNVGFARISLKNLGELSNYVTNDLVGHYDGINNSSSGHTPDSSSWYDLSSSANNAIINGSANTSWTSDGIELDGIDDYVQINNTSYSLLPSAHEFTLEYVLTIRPTSGTYFGTYGLNHHYWIIQNNKTFLSMNRNATDTANNWPGSSSMDFSDNTTHTFAETYSDNGNGTFTLQYYYDGFPLSTTASITAAAAYAEFLRLGVAYNSAAYYAGNLKSIRIYDKALSRLKIYENYVNDLVRFGT